MYQHASIVHTYACEGHSVYIYIRMYLLTMAIGVLASARWNVVPICPVIYNFCYLKVLLICFLLWSLATKTHGCWVYVRVHIHSLNCISPDKHGCCQMATLYITDCSNANVTTIVWQLLGSNRKWLQ